MRKHIEVHMQAQRQEVKTVFPVEQMIGALKGQSSEVCEKSMWDNTYHSSWNIWTLNTVFYLGLKVCFS